MKLFSILDEELVFFRLPGNTREELYRRMLEKAAAVTELGAPAAEITEGILKREDALGMPYDGCAFPHLRNNKFDDLRIIIGVPENPVKLKDDDVSPCKLIVMSLISQETGDLYLKAIAAFARFLLIPGNLDNLVGAGDESALLEVLRQEKITIRSAICADDLCREASPLKAEDPLSSAIDIMSKESRAIIPVVDGCGKLIGELTAQEVLRHFIPEYIFRMENIDFINSFEPFARIFKEETTRTVGDFMSPCRLLIAPETPLIQFTAKMVKGSIRRCFVVNAEGKLVGEISMWDIMRKVLRG